MAIDFPTPAAVGEKFTAGNIEYSWNGQGWTTGSGFVAPPVTDLWVDVTGDTMTGGLQIVMPSAFVNLSKSASGQFVFVQGCTAGLPRWAVKLGNEDPEGGTNTGSNFEIAPFNDDGTEQVNPSIIIARNTSNVGMNASLTCTGPITGAGINIKQGMTGVPGGSVYNTWWDGTASLWIDNTNVGVYVPASDYRIKKDVTPLTSMWGAVKALNPIKYTQAEYGTATRADGTTVSLFAADSIERWGFIAHELQATLTPSAASGVKDQPNAIQSPNPFTLLAAVTKALQETMTRLEAVEAQLNPARR